MTVYRMVWIAEVLVDGAGAGLRAIIRDKERTIERRMDGTGDAQCELDLKHLSWLLYYMAGNWPHGLGTIGPAFVDPRQLGSNSELKLSSSAALGAKSSPAICST